MQATNTLTCEILFQQWMKYKEIFVDINTIKWYNGTLTSLQKTNYASKPASIKKAETYEFVRKLKSELNPETLKRKLENLDACWQWAIEHEYVQSNPWKGLASQIKVPQLPKPKPFTTEEISKIIATFQASDRYRQLAPFVQFLFLTGLRTGEAIGLRWGDLSADLSSITVARQITRRKAKPAKCGKIRSFQLSSSSQALLKELKGDRNPTSGQTVFLWNGHIIDPVNFRGRVWTKMLEEAGVEYRPFYFTRHTFISHCLEKGLNPTIIAAITGHDVSVLWSNYAGCLYTPQAPDIL